MIRNISLLLMFLGLIACSQPPTYDIIIRNGFLYDGSGSDPMVGDIAIQADTIAAIGDLSGARSDHEIDGTGLSVAPGFINMLSWSTESLLIDGKSQSDIRQGVTLEVFGEGVSMGPLNDQMKQDMLDEMHDYTFEINWTTLGEYLEAMTRRGISCNVASFVGATTLRMHAIGMDNRPPSSKELEEMKILAAQAMEEGALGIGASLIYAPASYSSTDELVELCKIASSYGGMYIAHMRNEGNSILRALDETIEIAREANIPAEIYHLKVAGRDNWQKIDTVFAAIAQARNEGIAITADMYTYTAGATGLDAAMPTWVQEGGINDWIRRLQDPAIRKKVINEMRTPSDTWENLLLMAGSPDRVLLVSFANDSLKKFTGKTLSEVATLHGKSAEETILDLVITDSTRVGTVYFMMSEENIKKQIRLPYVSFGSDAASQAPEGVFLKSSPHPRAYGNFARLLSKYVRDEGVISLQEAIRRLTSLPASNLKVKKRGQLLPGFFADLVVFDAAKIKDHATFDNPHQFATGVIHVFVNGEQVLSEGEHTGAVPGRIVRGPGWKKSSTVP